MQFISTQKFLIISPKKLKPIVMRVKKLSPEKALEILPFISRKGSGHIEKVIKTALANAKEKNINSQDLYIKDILVNQGPRLKRGREVSRGRWHPYKKRMSHIKVILEEKKKEKLEKQGKVQEKVMNKLKKSEKLKKTEKTEVK